MIHCLLNFRKMNASEDNAHNVCVPPLVQSAVLCCIFLLIILYDSLLVFVCCLFNMLV